MLATAVTPTLALVFATAPTRLVVAPMLLPVSSHTPALSVPVSIFPTRTASIVHILTRLVTAVLATASTNPKSTGGLSVVASAAATTTTVAQGGVRTITTVLAGKSISSLPCNIFSI